MMLTWPTLATHESCDDEHFRSTIRRASGRTIPRRHSSRKVQIFAPRSSLSSFMIGFFPLFARRSRRHLYLRCPSLRRNYFRLSRRLARCSTLTGHCRCILVAGVCRMGGGLRLRGRSRLISTREAVPAEETHASVPIRLLVGRP
jgi:hypothetical protein